MSDFITELRREVVGAHAAHQRRPARASRMRRWRPALAGAVAIAAVLVAIVVAVRSLPSPEPSEPHVIKVLRLGGIPVDGVFADGALWVADSERSLVMRVDPDTRRVVARIRLTGNVAALAVGEDGVWVRAAGDDNPSARSRLSRIDPRTNRIAATLVVPPRAGRWP